MEAIHIYVAKNGCDCACGSKSEPLATLEGAKKLLASLDTSKGATVTVCEGEYNFDSSVVLDTSVSGGKDAPVIIEAEGNVIFSGAVSYSADKAVEVTDEVIAKKLPNPSIVKAVDLAALNINTNIGALMNEPRFYAGDSDYMVARYPNKSSVCGYDGPYKGSSHIEITDSEPKTTTFFCDEEDAKERLKNWSEDSVSNMLLRGYMWQQWSNCCYHCISVDKDKGTITAKSGAQYEGSGVSDGKHRRFFVTNIPEELDAPGEYFYDKASKVLYFIPNEDFNENTVMNISMCDVPAIYFDNAQNIVIKGIKFHYFTKESIIAHESQNIKIQSCELAHVADLAASVQSSSDVVFDTCDIFDAAAGGLGFDNCGDRHELINSGNAVINCIIRDYNRLETCYRPGIACRHSCGLLIKGNTIKDAPHFLIMMYFMNDIMIEDNKLMNACLDTDDASAIYWGRDPSNLGVVVRHNYFANIGNDVADYSLAAIYMDDWTTCCDVYNNIFYNSGRLSQEKMTQHTNATALVLNNAQFMNAHNNMFIGVYEDQKPTNLYPTPSLARWLTSVNGIEPKEFSSGTSQWHDLLDELGFYGDTWINHYRNTNWERMWDYTNKEIYQRVLEYREAHKEDSDRKQYVDMAWMVLDAMWDHYSKDGSYFPGTFYEYVSDIAKTDEELKKLLDEGEKNSPTQPWTNLESKIFWMLVNHEIKFRQSNIFENNLVIGTCRDYLTEDEHLKGHVMNGFYNNYVPKDDKLANGESMFIEYGENFELTADGLAEIHKHMPTFHNISMKNMGAKR